MNYFFDFDGTLMDSMPTWAGVHINMLKRFNIDVPEDFVKTITPLGNKRASLYAISLGVDLSYGEYTDIIEKTLFYEYTEKIVLKSKVAKTLTELKKKGHSLRVLTASPHKYVDPCLARNGIFDLFDDIWSIDDFGYTKGETAIYNAAAERIGAPLAECVMVDDNVTAIKTAAEAGMRTVGVYDGTADSLVDDMKRASELYIYEFDEILNF